MDSRQERLARNESIFRDVNERVGEVASSFDLGRGGTGMEFVCECSDGSCFEQVSLTLGEYEAVRARPIRFLLSPGHVDARVDRVVAEHERYVVVEKIGEAAETAAELDPRS